MRNLIKLVGIVMTLFFVIATPVFGADDCARLADGDVALKMACEAFERSKAVTDDALRESRRILEESGQITRDILKEREMRSQKFQALKKRLELEQLLEEVCYRGGCVGI